MTSGQTTALLNEILGFYWWKAGLPGQVNREQTGTVLLAWSRTRRPFLKGAAHAEAPGREAHPPQQHRPPRHVPPAANAVPTGPTAAGRALPTSPSSGGTLSRTQQAIFLPGQNRRAAAAASRCSERFCISLNWLGDNIQIQTEVH